jgi:hypothetical protein
MIDDSDSPQNTHGAGKAWRMVLDVTFSLSLSLSLSPSLQGKEISEKVFCAGMATPIAPTVLQRHVVIIPAPAVRYRWLFLEGLTGNFGVF